MKRDEALRALQEGLKEALGYHGPVLFARENMAEIIAALSSCACGGEPVALVDECGPLTGNALARFVRTGNLTFDYGMKNCPGYSTFRVLIFNALSVEEAV